MQPRPRLTELLIVIAVVFVALLGTGVDLFDKLSQPTAGHPHTRRPTAIPSEISPSRRGRCVLLRRRPPPSKRCLPPLPEPVQKLIPGHQPKQILQTIPATIESLPDVDDALPQPGQAQPLAVGKHDDTVPILLMIGSGRLR